MRRHARVDGDAVAKEEAELWPLFEKHFSFEEQEKIVGQIIGRTGAEVLRSMLIWVRDALNEDEREGMISSMRHAIETRTSRSG